MFLKNHIVISENMIIICHNDSAAKVALFTYYIPRIKHSAWNTTSNQLHQVEVTSFSRLFQIIFKKLRFPNLNTLIHVYLCGFGGEENYYLSSQTQMTIWHQIC